MEEEFMGAEFIIIHEASQLVLQRADCERLEALGIIYYCPDCPAWHVVDGYSWLDIYEVLGIEVEE